MWSLFKFQVFSQGVDNWGPGIPDPGFRINESQINENQQKFTAKNDVARLLNARKGAPRSLKHFEYTYLIEKLFQS